MDTESNTRPVEITVEEALQMKLREYVSEAPDLNSGNPDKKITMKVKAVQMNRPFQVENAAGRLEGGTAGDYLILTRDKDAAYLSASPRALFELSFSLVVKSRKQQKPPPS